MPALGMQFCFSWGFSFLLIRELPKTLVDMKGRERRVLGRKGKASTYFALRKRKGLSENGPSHGSMGWSSCPSLWSRDDSRLEVSVNGCGNESG